MGKFELVEKIVARILDDNDVSVLTECYGISMYLGYYQKVMHGDDPAVAVNLDEVAPTFSKFDELELDQMRYQLRNVLEDYLYLDNISMLQTFRVMAAHIAFSNISEEYPYEVPMGNSFVDVCYDVYQNFCKNGCGSIELVCAQEFIMKQI